MEGYHSAESQRRLQRMAAAQNIDLAGQLSGQRGNKAVKLADEGVTAIAMEQTA